MSPEAGAPGDGPEGMPPAEAPRDGVPGSHPAAAKVPAGLWATRTLLESQGFQPSKRLGQNLLTDINMARAIARDAAVRAGDFVVEIGPGGGALTLQLAALGVELVAIEIDARLLECARAALGPEAAVKWIHGDALASKHAWNPELVALLPQDRPWHLVSNLPYSAGSPILVVAARLDHPPASITVLLQTEVAQRIAAEPGGGDYGPLTIRLQQAYVPRLLRRVPAQLFWPRPKVDSSVLRLELRADRPPPDDLESLDQLVDRLFQHRRQAVEGLLAKSLGSREGAVALLADHGVEPRARPENLSPAVLLALARDPRWRGRARS